MCLVAEPALVRLHAAVVEYAVRVNATVAQAHEVSPGHPLSGGALFSIRADYLGLHRCVMTLCTDGWAFAAVPILRTMMELMISTAVIVADPAEAEYRGFKYTHAFLKANLNNEAFPPEQRARMRQQVEKGIESLPEAFRARAK